METNIFAIMNNIKNIITNIYSLTEKDIKMSSRDIYWGITFDYKGISIITQNHFTYDYHPLTECYEIILDKEGYETVEFYELYAFYENKPFDFCFNYKQATEYFLKLKDYISNNKLYFIKFDNTTKKDFLYFNNEIRELPQYNSTESYYYALFGAEGKRILDNAPIYKHREGLLLSEMSESDLINNCGFWSRLKKIWNTTVGKIGTLVTVVACVTVGVICTVIQGSQLDTALAIAAAVGILGGCLTAGIASYVHDGKIDWHAVIDYAVAGGFIGAVSAGASYEITSVF